ncbi:hypothetical protein Droror1_Dr00007480 [Drosera rotundifolia]
MRNRENCNRKEHFFLIEEQKLDNQLHVGEAQKELHGAKGSVDPPAITLPIHRSQPFSPSLDGAPSPHRTTTNHHRKTPQTSPPPLPIIRSTEGCSRSRTWTWIWIRAPRLLHDLDLNLDLVAHLPSPDCSQAVHTFSSCALRLFTIYELNNLTILVEYPPDDVDFGWPEFLRRYSYCLKTTKARSGVVRSVESGLVSEMVEYDNEGFPGGICFLTSFSVFDVPFENLSRFSSVEWLLFFTMLGGFYFLLDV